MPDISTINGIDIATLASFNGVALADGQTLEGQNVALGGGESHEFISTTGTISGISQVTITGFDSTYDIYEIHYINIPSPSSTTFWRFLAKAGSTTLANTNSEFKAYRSQSSSSSYTLYPDSGNTDQATWIQMSDGVGNSSVNSYESGNAVLRLYSPSNTTYGKLFESVCTSYHWQGGISQWFTAGIFNTTSAITSIVFFLSNMSDGEMRLYGIKK